MKYKNLKYDLYKLNWINILNEAIKSRPTSWSETPVREWRNAGDTICSSLIRALEEKKLIPSFTDAIQAIQTYEDKKYAKSFHMETTTPRIQKRLKGIFDDIKGEK